MGGGERRAAVLRRGGADPELRRLQPVRAHPAGAPADPRMGPHAAGLLRGGEQAVVRAAHPGPLLQVHHGRGPAAGDLGQFRALHDGAGEDDDLGERKEAGGKCRSLVFPTILSLEQRLVSTKKKKKKKKKKIPWGLIPLL